MRKITTLATTKPEIYLKCHWINIFSDQSNISAEKKDLCT